MIPLANIPNHLQNRFKSKGELAKRVAYTYNKLQQTQQDERTSMKFYDDKSHQDISLNIAPSYCENLLFSYENDSFRQHEFKSCHRVLSDANTFDTVQISKDGATTTHKNLYTQELINIPGPSLVTNKDGSSQTKYNYYTSVHYDKDTRTYSITKLNFSYEQITNFIPHIHKNSSAKRQEFKNQFNCVQHKKELFDKPVDLATIAFNTIDENAQDGEMVIIDLNDDGERIEVNKQGDLFDIQHYDDENQLSMQGQFTLLKDKNGIPLKEDKDGNILSKNDENYDNPQNTLCFDIDLTTFHKELVSDTKAFEFKRKVDLDDKKHKNNIEMKEYNRNGDFVTETNVTMPKYSESWIKHRFPKAYYDTFKSDLKAIKEYLTSQMLEPSDLNLEI